MNSLSELEPEQLFRYVRRRQVFDMDEQVQAQIARLEANVSHIQTDVADIKVDLRRTNDKVDRLREDLTQKIEGVREDLTQKIEGVRGDLTQKIEGVRVDLTGKIDGVREDLTAMKIWALGMYLALAGSLLFVMAKGFKWI